MQTRIALTLMAAGMAPAAAQSPIAAVLCGPRDQIETRLTGRHDARLAGAGVRSPEAVLEVWADPQGRWTLVQRYADGQSCILAMGADWATLPGAAG
jgi:hypothetical protein